MITIGALSKRTSVNIETIRYYERIRLIPRSPRSQSGRRLYNAEDIGRLTFIRHARELGFDIAVIRTMLALHDVPEASCEQMSRIAINQLAIARRSGPGRARCSRDTGARAARPPTRV